MNNNNFVDMGDEINEFEETINKPKNDNINEPKFPLNPKLQIFFWRGFESNYSEYQDTSLNSIVK